MAIHLFLFIPLVVIAALGVVSAVQQAWAEAPGAGDPPVSLADGPSGALD